MAKTVLEVIVAADPRSLESGLARAGKATDKFGKTADSTSRRTKRGFMGMEASATKLAKSLVGVGAAYLSIKGAKDAIATTQDLGKATAKLSRDLGLSTQEASRFAAVAKVRGIDIKSLSQSFGTLSKNAVAAADGGKTQAAAFKTLGISVKDVKAGTKDFNGLLGKVADGFKNTEAGPVRTAAAMKLLGKGWQTLGPLIAGGSKGIREQLALADKYGVTLGGKTVKSVGELAAAQREQQFATMGLQVQLGQFLLPALLKVNQVIVKLAPSVTKFAEEFRKGEGSGGKLRDTLEEVAAEAKRVYDRVRPIAEAVGGFIGKNPGILKVAAGMAAMGLAIKTIRFAGAISGLNTFLGAAAKIGAGPGKAIGSKVVGGIKTAFSAARNSLSSRFASTLGSAGSSAGATAADRTATSMAGGLRSGKSNGKFRSAGGVAGRIFGRAVAAGALVGVVGIGIALADKINEEFTNALESIGIGGGGPPSGANANGNSTVPGQGGADLSNTIRDFFGIGGRRKGGFISRFQDGGMVPAFVSPGEVIVHGGQAMTVPGARVAADSVFAQLPVGAAVLTDSGQSLMAGGASLSQAVAMQAPHFRKGGILGAGQIATLARGAGFGPQSAVAGAVGKAESGGDPKAHNTRGEDSRGLMQINVGPGANTQFRGENLFDPKTNLRIAKKVYAARNNTFQPWTMFTNGEYRKHLAAARQGGDVSGVSDGGGSPSGGTRTVKSSRTVLGGRYKGDALTAGFEAGLEGIERLRGSALTSIIGGGFGRRVSSSRTVSDGGGRPSPSRRSGGSRSGGSFGTGSGGTQNIDGFQVADWIVPILKQARGEGVGFRVTSGFRSRAKQAALYNGAPGNGLVRGVTVAAPGTSNHEGSRYPRGAVDLSPYQGFKGWLGNNSNAARMLKWYGPRDAVHFSATGRRRGGFIKRFQDGGWLGAGARKFTGTKASGGAASASGLASLIKGILAPAATDAKGVTAAFAGLLRRLEDGTRTTFTSLSQLIGSATSKAAAARKAGDRVGARRFDSIANVARDQQGRRLARPLVELGNISAALGRGESRFALKQRIAGVDSGSAAGISANIGAAQSSLEIFQSRMPGLKRALAQAKKRGNRKAITDITKAIEELDDTILERRADLGDMRRDLDAANVAAAAAAEEARLQAIADARVAKFDPFAKGIAAGSLALLRAQVDSPEDLADDLAALRSSLQSATQGYNTAVQANDEENILEFGGAILSLTSSIKSMEESVDTLSESMQANNALLEQQLAEVRRALAISQTEQGVMGRAIADLVSGQIGGRVGLGLQSPGFAGSTGGARY